VSTKRDRRELNDFLAWLRSSGSIQRAAELALTPNHWGHQRFGNGREKLSPDGERDHFCNVFRSFANDHPDVQFDDALVSIGLRRMWDGRRDIVQLVPVQLVGMQSAWLNGAQGMVDGFKDPKTEVIRLLSSFRMSGSHYSLSLSGLPSALSARMRWSFAPEALLKCCERSSCVWILRALRVKSSKKFSCQ
jgi:hypothetical protein